MDTELPQLIPNVLSVDRGVREHAEGRLRHFKQENLSVFLTLLSKELSNEDKEAHIHYLAGRVLKSSLDPDQGWLALDPALKSQIKTRLFQTLSSTVKDARSSASQRIIDIAAIELAYDEEPAAIELAHDEEPKILDYIMSDSILSSSVHEVTFEILAYLCEKVSQFYQDQIVFKLVQMSACGPEQGYDRYIFFGDDVRVAAIRGLGQVMGFGIHFTMLEFDNIMRVVLLSTTSPLVRIKHAAFECLDSICSTYYEKLAPYKHAISHVTTEAMKKNDDESVCLQIIEVWISISGQELELMHLEEAPFSEYSSMCPLFVVVPALLHSLEKKRDDHSRVEWNLPLAAGTCLGLLAQRAGKIIIHYIWKFMISSEWETRSTVFDASRYLLEAPVSDEITEFALGFLVAVRNASNNDPKALVKDAASLALQKMVKLGIIDSAK